MHPAPSPPAGAFLCIRSALAPTTRESSLVHELSCHRHHAIIEHALTCAALAALLGASLAGCASNSPLPTAPTPLNSSDAALPALPLAALGFALAENSLWQQQATPRRRTLRIERRTTTRPLDTSITTELAHANVTINPEASEAASSDAIANATFAPHQRIEQVLLADGSLALRELFNAEEGTTATFDPPLLWMPASLTPAWSGRSRVKLSGGMLARGEGDAETAGTATLVQGDASPELHIQIALRMRVGNVQIDRQNTVRLTPAHNAWVRKREERSLAVRALGLRVRSEQSVWEPAREGGS